MSSDLGQRGHSGVLFRNATMDFLAGWLLGYAQQGGMSAGALLDVYGRITDGDPDSWSRAFGDSARAAVCRAVAAGDDGHAGEAAVEWLAAMVAYRGCLAMLDPTGPDAVDTTRAMQRAFRAYLRASGTPLIPWQVPFDECLLPGYRSAAGSGRVAVVVGGGDTHAEDLWFFGGRALLAAGWSVVMVDLPGQGPTPYQGLHFGPQTLDALGRVLSAARLAGFDGEVALLGWSGGGIFVTRYAAQAASEDRLRAVVASTPVHDGARLMRTSFPRVLQSDTRLGRLMLGLAGRNRVLAASIAKYRWQFGPRGILGAVDLLGEVGATDVTAIDVPVLALVGGAEDAEALRQAREVVDAVRPRHPATRLDTFDLASGGAAHCQVGNLALALERACTWLDATVPAGIATQR